MESYFAAKLSPRGEVIYSTYIGPITCCNGPALAVDPEGNVTIAGNSTSSQFPVKNAFQATNSGGPYPNQGGDVVVLRLTAEGSDLIYSTYLGGSGDETANGIATDAAGNAYVVGSTSSTNFPTANPFQKSFGGAWGDAFVTKLSPDGRQLIYSTYLGGSNGDMAVSIVVGGDGGAYVVGDTFSRDFPVKDALQPNIGGSMRQAFFSKLSPGGDALEFSSHFGGTNVCNLQGLALGKTGDLYLAGYTASRDLPLVNPLQQFVGGDGTRFAYLDNDAFIARYNPAANKLVFSTFWGGYGGESIRALALDAVDNIYVVGETQAADFPTTPDALQRTFGGGNESTGMGDGFLSVIRADGSRALYSTFLGSTGGDAADAVAVSPDGHVLVGGGASYADFPIDRPVTSFPGRGPGFVAMFAPLSALARIEVLRSGNTVVISWPASVDGAVLERADALSPGADWKPVAVPPITVGERSVVTVEVERESGFLRLRR